MVRIAVLGPMHAEVDGAAAELGGPRQRGVLALLLASRGSVVSVDRMIEDLWRGEAPARAIASLQAYISNLRRALEPDRPPRTPAGILVSAAPGYAIRLDHAAVDAWDFEHRLTEARQATTVEALRLLEKALRLWHGSAYAEFADEEWAAAESARLDELHLAARELHTALTLRTGAAPAVPLAEQLTRQNPLHEEGWRLLGLALWGSGRQADALAAVRRARGILADELGLDPGPELLELESAILGQRMEILRASVATDDPVTVRPSAGRPPTTPPAPAPSAELRAEPGVAEPFVGRAAEIGALRDAARAARGSGAVALVSGEAGSGKSSLLRLLGRELGGDGWLVVGGRCPETEGAPPAWAWTEALRSLAERVPPGEHAEALGSLLTDQPGAAARDATAGRFRLHRAVCAWLAEAAATTPTAVLLDDIHAADAETLAMLTTAATELAGQPVLLLAAYRPADAGTPGSPLAETLAATLAALARRSPVRVPLAGLSPDDVTTLVAEICGSNVDSQTMAALAERTGGNPFYVKESARLLASEGALVATSDVPEGVRDVLRRRFARLPAPAVAVLRLAAVVGRESDVDVLVRAADVDEDGVLDALDAGLISGLLTEPAPGRVRFVHALVRDTLYTDLSGLRRTRWHARVAQELERLRPADLAGLAYHYAESASADTARLAVDYSVRAAEAAERRYAPDACVALLRQALHSLDHVAVATDDERVDLLGCLLRAEIRAGQIGAARQTRDRAVAVAERAGRQDLLLAAFIAWTEPTPWQIHPYGTVDERAMAHLTTLLARTDLDPLVRCQLLAVTVAELEGEGDDRLIGLADEAAALAEGSHDPWLRGLVLTTLTKDPAAALDPVVWDRIARELDDLHDLVQYRWFGEYLRAKMAAVEADVDRFLQHLGRAAEIAETSRMAEAITVTACGRAMYAHVRGDFEQARRIYLEATRAMARHGSLHADAFREFALLTVRFSEAEHLGDLEPDARVLWDEFAPLMGDIMAVIVGAGGDLAEARGLHAAAASPRYDYFWLIYATMRARAILTVGAVDEVDEMYESLLPFANQLAGAGTIALVTQPIALTLGDLAALAGRYPLARQHFEQALAVSLRWGSPHFEAAARRRLAEFPEQSPRAEQSPVGDGIQVDHR